MEYEHRQQGWIHWVVLAAAVPPLVLAGFLLGTSPAVSRLLGAAGLLCAVLALAFVWLEIQDRGDHLRVRFGPLPLFSKRIPYERIRTVRATRSALIDGLGIHWAPGRGWTWNIAGRSCVELELDRGRLRLGTDDAEGLARFLSARIQRR